MEESVQAVPRGELPRSEVMQTPDVSESSALGSVRGGRGVLFPIAEADNRLIRPASVHPEPLLWAITDPLLQGRVDSGHQRCSVGTRLTAAGQGQRREDRDTEACAIESLNPQRQHVAVESER